MRGSWRLSRIGGAMREGDEGGEDHGTEELERWEGRGEMEDGEDGWPMERKR